MIFHITEATRWRRSIDEGEHTGSTRGVELEAEGFIHCSTSGQWAHTVDRFYSEVADLVLLHIDEDLLLAPLVYEQLPGAHEPFPHVYGPINLDAVVRVEPISPAH